MKKVLSILFLCNSFLLLGQKNGTVTVNFIEKSTKSTIPFLKVRLIEEGTFYTADIKVN